jgi:HAD superfamily hydrolase (TIGR01509 family)
MRTALVTTASSLSVSALLHHFALEQVFDVVVAGDDVTRHKPDPEAYRLAITRLGVPAEECLAFEDSDGGIAGAAAAGVAAVRIVFS